VGTITLLTVMMGPGGAQLANAAEAQAATPPSDLTEVVVTGTRIIRDGYEAPTPLTVVGVEQVQQQATPNIADFINTLPAFSGSQTSQNTLTTTSNGSGGINSLNLRNLGAVRTLVLLDGQRSVGGILTGVVDINSFPQQLISRVDVVTGGASAAYGSDALSGVVNFILDKKFTGFKGEVSGGETNYSDNRNYKVAMSYGTPFASERGHLLLSGEVTKKDGILTPNRSWNDTGAGIVKNPAYTPTNGQPERIVLRQVSSSLATLGGLIVDGPLTGTAFGPGGTPYQFDYGSINDGYNIVGGDWRSADLHNRGESLDSKESRQNAFLRLSYDLTDNLNVYVESSWAHSSSAAYALSYEFYGGVGIEADNAFIPPSVLQQMTAAGLTSLELGTANGDLPRGSGDNDRTIVRNVVGGTGSFDLLKTRWTWDAYFQNGVSKQISRLPLNVNVNNFFSAIDAVTDPTSGNPVCRSTLSDPSDGCVPFNVFGTGVNSQAALDYILGTDRRQERFEENVVAASLSGEPFSDWAGPVSVAAGVEHRSESVSGSSDDIAPTGAWYVGNFLPTFGRYTVTEGFIETVVPLAKDQAWARNLDLNAAVRFTDYSTSGYVTTWKAGLTYAPVDDIHFRLTRSRDIRAPNLQDLFSSGTTTNNAVLDPFNNNQSTLYVGTTGGNPDLLPEKADTTGFGVVVQPRFLPGFSASVDYWNIDIKDALGTVAAQDIINYCFQGNQSFCDAITRSGNTGGYSDLQIRIVPFNLVNQIARGVDFEASYRAAMSDLVGNWRGDLTVRMLATHYLKDYSNNGINLPTDSVGENSDLGPPKWRWSASASYGLDAFNVTLAARGVSSGTLDNTYIECASNCPASTIDHPTIDRNYLPGAVYFDAALAYKLLDAGMEVFFNVRNIANKDPAIVPRGPSGYPFDQFLANPGLYDTMGRIYMLGVRFKI
jgi:outer membrane receptor protein involved in Fe transport